MSIRNRFLRLCSEGGSRAPHASRASRLRCGRRRRSAKGRRLSCSTRPDRADAGPANRAHQIDHGSCTFDFEVGVPVTGRSRAPVASEASRLPTATVARTVYHGPYEGLGAAWGEFGEWIAFTGHESAANLWECYVAGPESNPDPATVADGAQPSANPLDRRQVPYGCWGCGWIHSYRLVRMLAIDNPQAGRSPADRETR